MCQICQVTSEAISNPSMLSALFANISAAFLIALAWIKLIFPKKLKSLMKIANKPLSVKIILAFFIASLSLTHVLTFFNITITSTNYILVSFSIFLWLYLYIYAVKKVIKTKNELYFSLGLLALFYLLIVYPQTQLPSILSNVLGFFYQINYKISLIFCPGITNVCNPDIPLFWLITILYYQALLVLFIYTIKIFSFIYSKYKK